MKTGGTAKYGVGWIIADCFLIVDAIYDLYTGRTTGIELCAIIIFSIIFGALLIRFMKRRIRKERE